MLNAFRTVALIVFMTALFMAVGFVVGGTFGMILALMFAAFTNVMSYWNADKIVLRLQNAEPVDRRRAPELFEMIAGLARDADLPMPKVYVIHTEQPNAFATGRNPDNAAVAVSTGLLQHLERREIRAVIAHELAHVRNRDTLTMTMTATLAGAISILAQFGLFFGGRSASNPLGPIGSILMIIVAPIAAIMVQMAVSRTREYEADHDGAEISRDPLALASALDKIHRMSRNFENPFARRHPGMSHLFIVTPLAGKGTDNWFSTHPDVNNRIAALLEQAREMGQTPGSGRVADDWDEPEPRPVRRRVRIVTQGPAWRVPQVHRDDERDGPRGPWG